MNEENLSKPNISEPLLHQFVYLRHFLKRKSNFILKNYRQHFFHNLSSEFRKKYFRIPSFMDLKSGILIN